MTDVSGDNDRLALRAEFESMLEGSKAEIEEKWISLEGQPGADLFLVVPLRFVPLENDLQYRGRPLHADNVEGLEVRAYRRLV